VNEWAASGFSRKNFPKTFRLKAEATRSACEHMVASGFSRKDFPKILR
jgi:hypothetical protein